VPKSGACGGGVVNGNSGRPFASLEGTSVVDLLSVETGRESGDAKSGSLYKCTGTLNMLPRLFSFMHSSPLDPHPQQSARYSLRRGNDVGHGRVLLKSVAGRR
jgi:hypothetical protein